MSSIDTLIVDASTAWPALTSNLTGLKDIVHTMAGDLISADFGKHMGLLATSITSAAKMVHSVGASRTMPPQFPTMLASFNDYHYRCMLLSSQVSPDKACHEYNPSTTLNRNTTTP